jgi:hypothetical protein
VALVPTFARGTSGSEGGRSRVWTAKVLIAVQVALSLVLVVGAALFVRTLVNLRNEALGFRPEHVLLFQMDATLSGYKDGRLKDFYEEALRRVSATPGVRSASLSRWGILAGHRTTETITTASNASATQVDRDVYIHYVAPDYFRTMGMALAMGRDVAWTDREGTSRVAIVNEALARRSFDKVPLGQCFGFGGSESANDVEIVGVVVDARFSTLREPAPPTVYIPYRQNSQHQMTFAVRTEVEPAAIVEPLRLTLAALDANVPMFDVRTQDTQIDRSVKQERLFAQLLSGFAILALFGGTSHARDRCADGARGRAIARGPHGGWRHRRARRRRPRPGPRRGARLDACAREHAVRPHITRRSRVCHGGHRAGRERDARGVDPVASRVARGSDVGSQRGLTRG